MIVVLVKGLEGFFLSKRCTTENKCGGTLLTASSHRIGSEIDNAVGDIDRRRE